MSRRMLVAEDDLDIQGCRRTISGSEGFTVDACDTAAEKKRIFEKYATSGRGASRPAGGRNSGPAGPFTG